MSGEIFDWRVHATASGGGEFTTSKVQFGDGYAQEIPLGLNNEVQKWSVTVSGYRAELQPVMDFLRERAGQSFLWTPPMGTQGYYKCKSYTGPSDQGGGYFTLTMNFDQGFMPLPVVVPPPAAPAAPTYAYWRIVINDAIGPGYKALAELQFRASVGGANQCVGGVAVSNGNLAADYAAAKAFDGDTTTEWGSGGEWMNWIIGYEFLAPVAVAEVAIISTDRAVFSGSYDPRGFTVQHADAAAGPWTDAGSFVTPVWGASELRTFLLPEA